MENAVFLVPNGMVLAKVVDGIDGLDITNKDIMGDVYEYLLGKMASAGELGQFRTPRHIINMMVQLVKPTLKDFILDPAMGSAGFLLGCVNYVEEHQASDLMKTENSISSSLPSCYYAALSNSKYSRGETMKSSLGKCFVFPVIR